MNTVQQWDNVAFKLIADQLAPKGFKKVTKGAFRGATVAIGSLLSKETVKRCQSITAQVIRTFRNSAKKSISDRIADHQKSLEASQKALRACKFYQIRKRQGLIKEVAYHQAIFGALLIVNDGLDEIALPGK